MEIKDMSKNPEWLKAKDLTLAMFLWISRREEKPSTATIISACLNVVRTVAYISEEQLADNLPDGHTDLAKAKKALRMMIGDLMVQEAIRVATGCTDDVVELQPKADGLKQ